MPQSLEQLQIDLKMSRELGKNQIQLEKDEKVVGYDYQIAKEKEVDEKVIYLKDGHLNIKVRIDEMYWVKSDGHYIEVQTKQKRIVKRTSIESFISKYELDQFARVHRSYAVNLDLVDSIM